MRSASSSVAAADEDVVKAVIPNAKATYQKMLADAGVSGVECEVVLNTNEDDYLPPAPTGDGAVSCAGGVRLVAHNGCIVYDNTLDSRLAIAFQDLQPYVRSLLGKV